MNTLAHWGYGTGWGVVRACSSCSVFGERRHHEAVTFAPPDESYGRVWEAVIDTADPPLADLRHKHRDAVPEGRLDVVGRSVLVPQKRY